MSEIANNCPNPPGTLLRLNLGPVELDLLGLQVSIPSGLCLIVRAGTLSPIVQQRLGSLNGRKKITLNGTLPVDIQKRLGLKVGRRLKIRGTIINDGKSRSRIKIR